MLEKAGFITVQLAVYFQIKISGYLIISIEKDSCKSLFPCMLHVKLRVD